MLGRAFTTHERRIMAEVQEVQALQKKRGEAMIAANVDAIAELLDERCIYSHSSTLTDTKQTYVEALKKKEYTYHSVETVSTDHSVVIGDIVIVNGIMAVSMTVKSSGQTLTRKIRVSEVWTRSKGTPAWKLLLSHSTNIPNS
jgi:hypothetical protein